MLCTTCPSSRRTAVRSLYDIIGSTIDLGYRLVIAL